MHRLVWHGISGDDRQGMTDRALAPSLQLMMLHSRRVRPSDEKNGPAVQYRYDQKSMAVILFTHRPGTVAASCELEVLAPRHCPQ
jgi:hypothetical protein